MLSDNLNKTIMREFVYKAHANNRCGLDSVSGTKVVSLSKAIHIATGGGIVVRQGKAWKGGYGRPDALRFRDGE